MFNDPRWAVLGFVDVLRDVFRNPCQSKNPNFQLQHMFGQSVRVGSLLNFLALNASLMKQGYAESVLFIFTIRSNPILFRQDFGNLNGMMLASLECLNWMILPETLDKWDSDVDFLELLPPCTLYTSMLALFEWVLHAVVCMMNIYHYLSSVVP